MWKFIIFSLFIFELRQTVNAAVAILLEQRKPLEFACAKGCYVPELNRVLAVGLPYSPQNGTNCLQYTCGDDMFTQIFSCSAVGAGEGCQVVPGNLYLAYPDCCKQIQCKPTDAPSFPPDDESDDIGDDSDTSSVF